MSGIDCPKCGQAATYLNGVVVCPRCDANQRYTSSPLAPPPLSSPLSQTDTTNEFDPYHQWLGIPRSDQPANHYRLLGIQLFESNPDVIESAADRQMAHVRLSAIGPRAALTQQILNEIATANVCLLAPQEKATYDADLRASVRQGSKSSPASVEGYQPKSRSRSASGRRASPTQNVRRTLVVVFGGFIGIGITLGLLSLIREQEAKRAREDLARQTRKEATEVQPQNRMTPRKVSRPTRQTQAVPPEARNASQVLPHQPEQPISIPDAEKETELPFPRRASTGGGDSEIPAAKGDRFTPSKGDTSVGTAVIDTAHGEIVIENVPGFVVGKGEPKSDSMWYTGKSAAGSHIVTIHNTPFGDCDVKLEMNGSSGVHATRFGADPLNPRSTDLKKPFVVVRWSDGNVTGVSWDGESVGRTKPDFGAIGTRTVQDDNPRPNPTQELDKRNAVIEGLIKQLDDADPDVRSHAARELSKYGPASEGALPKLAELLDDLAIDVRLNAINAIGNIGEKATPLIPTMYKMFSNEDPQVREWLAVTISDIDPMCGEFKKIANTLLIGRDVHARDEMTQHRRRWMADRLIKIGPDAKWAALDIRRLLRSAAMRLDHDHEMFRILVETLVAIGANDNVTKELLEDFKHGRKMKPTHETSQIVADTALRKLQALD